MINVTKTYLPPLEEYQQYLNRIWEAGWVTNNGQFVKELEQKLKSYLGVKHLFLVANGTMGLQIALKALDLKGEIITTPLSFVATTSCMVWQNCKPVFVDIDKETLTLNAENIEAAITEDTTAILATHIYGIPCAVNKIAAIAEKNNLKVIYDNAHGFGIKHQGKSLSAFGDISVLSMHATKLFHTIEGGALITEDDEVAHKISYMRNFGLKGHEDWWGLGVNGKQSELHAAMGLCILPKVNDFIEERKKITTQYDELLLRHPSLTRPRMPEETTYNYIYYPILFSSEHQLLKAKKRLEDNKVFPRRYFPSLSNLPYISKPDTPIADDVAKRVLCLPLYQGLSKEIIVKIAVLIIQSIAENES